SHDGAVGWLKTHRVRWATRFRDSDAIGDPQGEEVDVAAEPCVPEERSGEEVGIARDHGRVPVRLPPGTQGELAADGASSARLPRCDQGARGAVDAVGAALTKKRVVVQLDRERVRWMHRK